MAERRKKKGCGQARKAEGPGLAGPGMCERESLGKGSRRPAEKKLAGGREKVEF